MHYLNADYPRNLGNPVLNARKEETFSVQFEWLVEKYDPQTDDYEWIAYGEDPDMQELHGVPCSPRGLEMIRDHMKDIADSEWFSLYESWYGGRGSRLADYMQIFVTVSVNEDTEFPDKWFDWLEYPEDYQSDFHKVKSGLIFGAT